MGKGHHILEEVTATRNLVVKVFLNRRSRLVVIDLTKVDTIVSLKLASIGSLTAFQTKDPLV